MKNSTVLDPTWQIFAVFQANQTKMMTIDGCSLAVFFDEVDYQLPTLHLHRTTNEGESSRLIF